MFESHQVIFAENVASESFFPGPMALKTMQPQDRAAFFTVMPALGNGVVDRQTVIDLYVDASRAFLTRKAVAAIQPPADTPKPTKMKTPSAAVIQASAELAQTKSLAKNCNRFSFKQHAIAC